MIRIIKKFSMTISEKRLFGGNSSIPMCYHSLEYIIWMATETTNTDPDKVVSHILISDIALGLEYLHNEDIVHGDLKELNILVTESYRACICDFGLSHLGVTLGLPPSTYRGGTLGYMAPEVLFGSLSSKQSDVYSYGSLCHKILSKVYDLPNNLVRGLGGDLASQPPPANLPKDEYYLWSLLQDCWKQEPSSRPTARDIVRRVATADAVAPAPNWNESLHSSIRNNIDLMLLVRELESRCRSRRQITSASTETVGNLSFGGGHTPNTDLQRNPVSPSPQATEREQRIEELGGDGIQTISLRIGNHHNRVASPSPADNRSGNVHEWTFFVIPSRTDIIREVRISLHPTFKERDIILEHPPYSITRLGWGIFTIEVKVVLKSGYSWVSEDAWNSPNGEVKSILPLEWELDFSGGSQTTYALEVKNKTVHQKWLPRSPPHKSRSTEPYSRKR
ncbi:hypothetical protein E1B28_003856 [Marasmius oreades]|uniref:Protein kinase domain-containing protein n=1 Tax=Marasmius oreades TaxID=181124 RepID=A0A9P8ABM5_9AGAR|nr:uncharacterized protein E1B28_003856 [Marasmius oreades]KAG7096417.1 hypothetical protein E1B28_003856 [Marasmius oreades]